MPLYAYHCPACSRNQDIFKKIVELDREETCPTCRQTMQRKLSAPMVIGDYPGYNCPITGAWVEGRKAHQENLKKHGCRVLEPGEAEGVKRQHAASEAALDAAVDATVEEFIETLPTAKKEQLAAEVQNGLDVELVRN